MRVSQNRKNNFYDKDQNNNNNNGNGPYSRRPVSSTILQSGLGIMDGNNIRIRHHGWK